MEKNASTLLANFQDKKTRLWFAGSTASDISEHTKTLATTLETDAPEELIWKYSDESNEKHNAIFRATKEKALTWTLNTKED